MHFDSIKGEKPETVEVRGQIAEVDQIAEGRGQITEVDQIAEARGQIAELKTLRLDGRAFGAKMVERNPAETSPAGTSYLSPAL